MVFMYSITFSSARSWHGFAFLFFLFMAKFIIIFPLRTSEWLHSMMCVGFQILNQHVGNGVLHWPLHQINTEDEVQQTCKYIRTKQMRDLVAPEPCSLPDSRTNHTGRDEAPTSIGWPAKHPRATSQGIKVTSIKDQWRCVFFLVVPTHSTRQRSRLDSPNW